MSQQSLSSKTITKRNVAQSSVIFSVVVAVITLGVIATVAYIDIKEDINSVAAEKSIPEMIADQKIRAEESRKEAELVSQAEDLVLVMDQRVENLKQLQHKVNMVNEQLNFVTTQLKTNSQVATPSSPQSTLKPVFHSVKAVQTVANALNQLQNDGAQQSLDSIFDQNHAFKLSAGQHATAAGEMFFEISWLFKARGSMDMRQDFLLSHQLNAQNLWNAKTF